MKSIRQKLWVVMIGLVGVILLFLWLFQIVFIEKFYTSIRIADIKTELRLLAKSNPTTEQIDEITHRYNISVEVLDANGNLILGGSGEQQVPPMMKDSACMSMMNNINLGKEATYTMMHPKFNTQVIFIGIPTENHGFILGMVSMAPLSETVEILKKQLFYVTGILLVVAVLASYFLAKGFTKPILKITEVSKQMAAGDFTARVKIQNKDEIGRLGETINEMGEELSKIEQLRKDLIANVSHELRTPLSIIQGYAETIRDVNGHIPEKRVKGINIIVEETERLNQIVTDILNLSQMQAGYTSLNKQKFQLEYFLMKIIERFEVVCREKGIYLSLEMDEDITVLADEGKLNQVLYNFIQNAIVHTPVGKNIVVRSWRNKEKVRVEVINEGVGINAEDLPYIWERFYKQDKTGNRKESGTGLGLSIVKAILEAHHFTYGVMSEPNKETVFWFEL